MPFYRQDNDLNPGESFSLLAQNDDGSQGTLVYTTPAGVSVSVEFLGEEAQRVRRHRRLRVHRHGDGGLTASRSSVHKRGAVPHRTAPDARAPRAARRVRAGWR